MTTRDFVFQGEVFTCRIVKDNEGCDLIIGGLKFLDALQPQAMDDPMGGEGPNAMGGEDDELMNIINGLSIEDKAAVTKYAKSMADDSEGAEDPMMGGEMPMESKRGMKSIIDEVLNDVLDNQEGTKRPEKKMPRQYRDMEMPFKSPF